MNDRIDDIFGDDLLVAATPKALPTDPALAYFGREMNAVRASEGQPDYTPAEGEWITGDALDELLDAALGPVAK